MKTSEMQKTIDSTPRLQKMFAEAVTKMKKDNPDMNDRAARNCVLKLWANADMRYTPRVHLICSGEAMETYLQTLKVV